jgi:hypothetical protein
MLTTLRSQQVLRTIWLAYLKLSPPRYFVPVAYANRGSNASISNEIWKGADLWLFLVVLVGSKY